MGVTTTNNKPLNPRGNDQSPLAYNRAKLFSGKALDFDGVNDNVDLDGFTLSGTTATICFNALTTGANRYFFWVGGQNYGIINHDTLGFGIFDSTTWNYFGTTERSKMSFYCVVNEGTTQRVYCNGVQIGSEETALAIDWSSPSKVLLGSNNAENEFLNGQIAGFKIFNTALTAAQVADLYNNPEKVVPTGVDNTALKLFLPMQEGAGTTAYDGSGNGNHGTISGATYTHGIGAPVSQTAVIDWNKGTNLLEYTNIFDGYWTKSGGTLTTGIEAPDGTNTAFKFERDDSSSGAIYNVAPAGLSSTNYRYVYAKLPTGTGSAQLLSHNTNTNNTFTITDEWQRFEVNSAPNTAPTNFYIIDFRAGVGVDEIHLWAPQAAAGTTESVFVPTIGTAQSSEVLLPQGLTTGRDITGVNLFENVRKQGALNLDGNSWAEVHDNASLDVSEFTLEGWIYTNSITSDNRILSKWFSGYPNRTFQFSATNDDLYLYISDGSSSNNTFVLNVLSLNNWYHCVATYDGANLKIYLDGVLKETTASTMTLKDSNEPVYVGAYVGSLDPSDNTTAQPRIYNRALTAEEVARNYNNAKSIYTNS